MAFGVSLRLFPQRLKHLEVLKTYLSLAIIAFGAFELIVPN